jgi:hypothetical protein
MITMHFTGWRGGILHQSWDTRWYLDDGIVANKRVGPAYFNLIQPQVGPAPAKPQNLRTR